MEPPPTEHSPPVLFTDAEILAARVAGKNPLGFPDDIGTYEDPGLIIAGGNVPQPLPANVPCIGTLVIYSSWAQAVANCAGFAGPAANNNAVVLRALQNANQTAAAIPCDTGCAKRVVEIWRGWQCGNNPLTATAAIELKIHCEIPDPT